MIHVIVHGGGGNILMEFKLPPGHPTPMPGERVTINFEVNYQAYVVKTREVKYKTDKNLQHERTEVHLWT